MIERACVLSPGAVVEIVDELRPAGGGESAPAGPAFTPDAIVTLEESERIHIRQALASTAGRIHGHGRRGGPARHQSEHSPIANEEARHHEAAPVAPAGCREGQGSRRGTPAPRRAAVLHRVASNRCSFAAFSVERVVRSTVPPNPRNRSAICSGFFASTITMTADWPGCTIPPTCRTNSSGTP